ncbi:MAG: hypothetical protein F8N39_04120 [Clostridiaceae bacterium]|nr:hypothetical protein [Clostridiaceae bacterium]
MYILFALHGCIIQKGEKYIKELFIIRNHGIRVLTVTKWTEKRTKKLKEDKQNLIIQLVEMEELKDENKRLREQLEKLKSIK